MSVLVKGAVAPPSRRLAARYWRLCVPTVVVAAQPRGPETSDEKAMHTNSPLRLALASTFPRESTAKSNDVPPIVSTERDHFHAILENSIHYTSTIARPDLVQQHVDEWEAEEQVRKDWAASSPEELLHGIKILRYHALSTKKPFEAERYEPILNAAAANLSTLDDESIKSLLKYLHPLAKHLRKNPAFMNLRNNLNDECIDRFIGLPLSQEKLLLADMLHNLDRTYKFNFLWHIVRKLGCKAWHLSPRHLVQLLYFLAVSRKPPINMYEMEHRFGQCMNAISIDEIGIAALGFFKTQTRIREERILIEIIQRLSLCIEDVSPITLGAIMKLLRYSVTYATSQKFSELLIPAIVSQVPRLPLSSLSHFLQTMAKLSIYDRDLFVAVEEKYVDTIKSARIKDLARIVYSVSLVAPEGSHKRLYESTIEELTTTIKTTREEENARFPSSLPHILLYLSYKNIYPQKLIEHVMEHDRLYALFGSSTRNLPFDLCALDHNLKVDLPNYTGPTLKEGVNSYLMPKFREDEKARIQSNKTEKLIQEIATSCMEIFHSELVHVDLVLPQYPTKDIIIVVDKKNREKSVKEQLSAITPGTIKRVDLLEEQEDCRWIAVVVCPKHAIVQNSGDYNCIVNAKLRQLRLIGYTPVTVSIAEWKKLNMSNERHTYLRNIMKI